MGQVGQAYRTWDKSVGQAYIGFVPNVKNLRVVAVTRHGDCYPRTLPVVKVVFQSVLRLEVVLIVAGGRLDDVCKVEACRWKTNVEWASPYEQYVT